MKKAFAECAIIKHEVKTSQRNFIQHFDDTNSVIC